VGFWKNEVIGFALDHETRKHMDEQLAWIGREPANPRPYANLAQLYRMENRQEEALGLLLEAVRLDAGFAAAHVSLAEIYAVRGDYPAASRHAYLAEQNGDPQAIELLHRHGIFLPKDSYI
jgi:tetratricopeptide (TPR) repeat protein